MLYYFNSVAFRRPWSLLFHYVIWNKNENVKDMMTLSRTPPLEGGIISSIPGALLLFTFLLKTTRVVFCTCCSSYDSDQLLLSSS